MRKNLACLMGLVGLLGISFVLGVFHGKHVIAVADADHAEIPILHFKQLSMDNTEHERWHAYAVAALRLPKWHEGTPIAEWSNPRASADWAIKVEDLEAIATKTRKADEAASLASGDLKTLSNAYSDLWHKAKIARGHGPHP